MSTNEGGNLTNFLFFYCRWEPAVWEIAVLVRIENYLLTTDILAVNMVAGLFLTLILTAMLGKVHTISLTLHCNI